MSDETVAEYLGVLRQLGVTESHLTHLKERFTRRKTVPYVKLGARFKSSRDPDDNLILATAAAGKAKYLVTNDRDLLELAATERKRFKVGIVTPAKLLRQLEVLG